MNLDCNFFGIIYLVLKTFSINEKFLKFIQVHKKYVTFYLSDCSMNIYNDYIYYIMRLDIRLCTYYRLHQLTILMNSN